MKAPVCKSRRANCMWNSLLTYKHNSLEAADARLYCQKYSKNFKNVVNAASETLSTRRPDVSVTCCPCTMVTVADRQQCLVKSILTGSNMKSAAPQRLNRAIKPLHVYIAARCPEHRLLILIKSKHTFLMDIDFYRFY